MIVPLEEREEVFVINKNRDLMLKLRESVSKNFPGTWIFLHRHDVKKIWGLEVANGWGNKLSADNRSEVEQFINDFMLKYNNEG